MAQLNHNSMFASYNLTESELRMAKALSPETRMLIQNLIAATAGDKVNALYDPNNPMLSIQQDARFQGQLDAYTLLLAYHDEVTTEHDTAIKVNLNPEEM